MSKEFNAAVGLKDFDPTVSRPFASSKNALEADHVYTFADTGERENWGDKKFPVVKGDDGVKCNAPYVASCMIQGQGIILNPDNEKLRCMHIPRTATNEKLNASWVQQNLRPDGSFPKLKVVETLPIAMKKADLLANAKPETLAVYQQVLGTPLEKVEAEYVPSYRKSNYGGGDGVYSIKSSIVELVSDEAAAPVEEKESK